MSLGREQPRFLADFMIPGCDTQAMTYAWIVSTPMMTLGGNAHSSHTGYCNDFPQGFTESHVRYAKTTRRSDTKRPHPTRAGCGRPPSLGLSCCVAILELAVHVRASCTEAVCRISPLYHAGHSARVSRPDASVSGKSKGCEPTSWSL
jgi:hypothetical protein